MPAKRTILVTGGAGFIGSHTLVDLLKADYRCIVLDNLDNASSESVTRVRELTKASPDDLWFGTCDLVDLHATRAFVRAHAPLHGCIHFAGFKAVGESVAIPIVYYYNNVVGTLHLLQALSEVGCHSLVFSSSATVYGTSQNMPLVESERLGATNAYGNTKLQIEEILRDLGRVPKSPWRIAILRYFNPVGAHPSGRIGEDPQGTPSNLLPFVAQVAVGLRPHVNVFGSDYPTPDGTGVRDFIHVMDLARAHRAAIEKITSDAFTDGSVEAYNVGTGKGSSVLEVIAAFERASGRKIPYVLAPRRPGDVATSYCDPSKALKELGFKTQLTLDDACADAWRWQQANPHGYRADTAAAASPSAQDARKAIVFKLLSKDA